MEAGALLQQLTDLLYAAFGGDHRYRSYLASYLKTAERFLSVLCVAGHCVHPVPEAALIDCERAVCSIGRELAMTCEALRPIVQPTLELAMPGELDVSKLVECATPPTAHPLRTCSPRSACWVIFDAECARASALTERFGSDLAPDLTPPTALLSSKGGLLPSSTRRPAQHHLRPDLDSKPLGQSTRVCP